MGTPNRSAAMVQVLERLAQMQHSAAWLGRTLTPPISRQTVASWVDVPDHYVTQVAQILKMGRARVRPDLAAIFAPTKEPSERAA